MYTRLIPFLLAGQLIIAAAVNYSYDAAGRLIGIDYGAAGSISYTYDNAGNVTSRTVKAGGSAASAIASAQFVRSNDGAARIEIHGVNLAVEGTTFTIDGKPAQVQSRCNAAVTHTCTTDQVSLLAPNLETAGRVQLQVTNGVTTSGPYWVRIHGPQKPKP